MGAYLNFEPESYVVLLDDTIIPFGPENTNIKNDICDPGYNNGYNINGNSISQNEIKKIVFGNNYSLDESQLYPGAIGFLIDNPNFEYIDISGLKSIKSFPQNFFHGMPKITTIKIGDLDFSINKLPYRMWVLTNLNNTSDMKLYADSNQLAQNFRAIAPLGNTSNWTVVVE